MPSNHDRLDAVHRARGVQDGLFHPPAPADCDDIRIFVPLSAEWRIDQRLWLQKGNVVKYAIILSRRAEQGNWVERYSVDTSHGYLHQHVSGHKEANDRRNVQPMYSRIDVEQSFDFAYGMVHNRYLEWKDEGGETK